MLGEVDADQFPHLQTGGFVMLDRYSISAVLGLVIAGSIIYLVRKDQLHSRYTLWWIPVALSIALTGLFPKAVDWAGAHLNIHYPPILPLIIAIGFLLVKILLMDIERSRNERKLHRLAQRMASYEARLFALETKGEEPPSASASLATPPSNK